MNDDSPHAELKARLLSGEIAPDEVQDALAALQSDPALLDEISASMAIDRLLGLAVEPEEEAAAFPLEVVQRLKLEASQDQFPRKVEKKLKPKMFQWRNVALPLAASIAILGVASWFILRDNSLARVRATADVAWPADSEFRLGSAIPRNGTITIDSGVLELELARRGHIALEGPASLTVSGRKEFTLQRGRAVVRVTKGGRGLIVHTPHGTAVDLGTSFALDVQADFSDLYVFDGSVRFDTDDQSEVILSADESLRSEATGEVTSIDLPTDHFIRKLPTPGTSREPSLHWRFDEGSGTTAEAFKSRGEHPVTLRNSNPGDSPPEWTNGPSGPALALSGTGAFGSTTFPGIEGSTNRTVALWVQVPEDWTPSDGGALVSWGRTDWQAAGSLFELALNTRPELGPIGAPQLDTFGTLATASAVLTDGQWHHLAVTTFQGYKDAPTTNVLFYLDGELLSSRPRAVPRIDTISGGVRHGVLLGRTIQSLNATSPPNSAFFRGSLDDVFIAPRALSSQQIKALKDGRPPRRR